MTNRTPNHISTHQQTTIMAAASPSPTTSTTTTTQLLDTSTHNNNSTILRPSTYTNQSRRPLSRRKRRKRQVEQPQQDEAAASDTCQCQTAAAADEPSNRTPASREPQSSLSWSSKLPELLPEAATRFLSKLLHTLTRSSPSYSTSSLGYMTYLLIALSAAATCCMAQPPCESHSWWDPVRDKCIPCTICQDEMIPLRPCQQHRDTICGSIYDLKIDWVVLAKTEPNWKERRKSDELEHFEQQLQQQHLTHEQLQQLQDEAGMPLDWQTGALFVAVLACLLFFIVAACILVHHMRQWRRMERRLDQDVEELSTKLMAKLVEVQSLEGGTFFIGNADALCVPSSAAMSSGATATTASAAAGATATQSSMFQTQYVLLPEKPTKHHDRRIIKNQQPGNVYIEESSSKG